MWVFSEVFKYMQTRGQVLNILSQFWKLFLKSKITILKHQMLNMEWEVGRLQVEK